MKNLFKQAKSFVASVMIASLFLAQFSSLLLQTPKTYALGMFATNEVQANVQSGAVVTGVQSVTRFTVFNPANDGDGTYIAGCVITIVSGGTSDPDCTDGVALLDPETYPTEAQQATAFGSFTFNDYVSAVTGFQAFQLTHVGPAIDGNAPSSNAPSSGGAGAAFLFTNNDVVGVADQAGTPAIAQIVDFIPSTPIAGDTYRATISGTNYDYTVLSGDTVQTIVEALSPLMDADTNVSCTEDDVKVTCTAAEAGMWFSYGATVLDLQAPVVTLSGSTPITVAQGSVYSDAGATYTDNVDGTGSAELSGSVNTAIVGSYLLQYRYIDNAGNTGNIVSRIVNVTDQTAPVVTLSGASNVDVEQNTTYTELGAVWTDNVDGSGSGVILAATSGTVNTNVPGIYTLEYTYTDMAGNTGNTVTRTVNVYQILNGGTYVGVALPTPNSPTTTPTVTPVLEPVIVLTGIVIDQNEILNPSIDSSRCFTANDKQIVYQGNNVSATFLNAQQLFLNHGLTTIAGTKDFNPQRQLTRAEAAKILSLFAKNILCRETTSTYSGGMFKDLAQTDEVSQSYLILSYEYGIFHGDVGGMFRPNDIISKDELTAVLIRLVMNEYNETQGPNRAQNYRKLLENNASIPLNNVTRGNAAEVLYDLYKNNTYTLDTEVGFVLK